MVRRIECIGRSTNHIMRHVAFCTLMKETSIGFGCKRIIFPFNFEAGDYRESESVNISIDSPVSTLIKVNLQPQKVTCCTQKKEISKLLYLFNTFTRLMRWICVSQSQLWPSYCFVLYDRDVWHLTELSCFKATDDDSISGESLWQLNWKLQQVM